MSLPAFMNRPACATILLIALLTHLPQEAGAQAQPALPPAPEIDLKLFEASEVDRSKGCSVALWQANRDPDKDRFAYIFTEDLHGKSHARDVARIKIGGAAVPIRRIAVGGKTEGYDLYEHQLYKMVEGDGYVVLDLKFGALEGEAVEIESGKLMVTILGKQAFRASVKGSAGCMTPPVDPPKIAPPKIAAPKIATPALPPKAASMTTSALAATASPGPQMFERYPVDPRHVSRGFTQEVRKKFKCDPAMMKTGITGFQLSEESAIWQIPCERAAYQSTAVFALVYVPAPEKQHEFLAMPGPPGHKRTSDPGVLMNPKWDLKTRTVTSIALGRAAGDCGVLERYRVTPEGQFALVEYREKPNCDGVPTRPEQFSPVFPQR